LSNEHAIEGRKDWLGYGDRMRIYACIAVVLLHTSAWVLFFDKQIVQGAWQFNNILSAACRWCVPLFVMLSGAIFLDRPIPGPARVFIWKRVKRVGIPLLFWSLVYFAWNDYSRMLEFSLERDISLFLKGQPYYHLYFLFVMIGLYIITPGLKAWLDKSAKKKQLIYTLVVMAVTSTAVLLGRIFSVQSANAFTFFIPFIGYYLAGFMLKDVRLSRSYLALAWLVFVATVLITSSEYLLLAKIPWVNDPREFDLLYINCSPVVMVMSVCVYLMISNLGPSRKLTGEERPKSQKALRAMGRTTFGIYIIHPIVLDFICAIYYWWLRLPETAALETIILAGSTVLISFALISILIKVPYLRDLVS